MGRYAARVTAVATLAMAYATAATGGGVSHTSWIMTLDLPATEATVALGVWDTRKDEVSGRRKPSWLGLERSLYGIPHGVTTATGKPFADDLTNYLVRSLARTGIEAEAVNIPVGTDREDTVKQLTATGCTRLLLFRLDEWYADTYVQTTLHYDVTLEVLDAAGATVSEISVSGEDDLGRRERPGRQSVTEATADILRTLLTRESSLQALASTHEVAEEAAKRCTVDQILSMRESGLTEEQIKAACGES
jgi:hypothetical protein